MLLKRLIFALLATLVFGQLASPAMAHGPRAGMADMGAASGHDGCAAEHMRQGDEGACSHGAGPAAAGCCVTACAAFIFFEPTPTSYTPPSAGPPAPALAFDAPSRSVEPPRRPPRAAS